MQFGKRYIVIPTLLVAVGLVLPAVAETPPAAAKGPAVTLPAKPPEPEKKPQQADKSAPPQKKLETRRKRRLPALPLPVRAAEAEALPGARLTMKQILEILKSTKNFSGKNMSGLKLVAFDLSKCNLKGADLSNTNLERADLSEANLERADLSGANLKMVDLRLAGLKGIKLERTLLDGAIWPGGTICARGSIGICREKSSPNRD